MSTLKRKELNNRLKNDACHLLIRSLEEKSIIHAHYLRENKHREKTGQSGVFTKISPTFVG